MCSKEAREKWGWVEEKGTHPAGWFDLFQWRCSSDEAYVLHNILLFFFEYGFEGRLKARKAITHLAVCFRSMSGVPERNQTSEWQEGSHLGDWFYLFRREWLRTLFYFSDMYFLWCWGSLLRIRSTVVGRWNRVWSLFLALKEGSKVRVA